MFTKKIIIPIIIIVIMIALLVTFYPPLRCYLFGGEFSVSFNDIRFRIRKVSQGNYYKINGVYMKDLRKTENPMFGHSLFWKDEKGKSGVNLIFNPGDGKIYGTEPVGRMYDKNGTFLGDGVGLSFKEQVELNKKTSSSTPGGTIFYHLGEGKIENGVEFKPIFPKGTKFIFDIHDIPLVPFFPFSLGPDTRLIIQIPSDNLQELTYEELLKSSLVEILEGETGSRERPYFLPSEVSVFRLNNGELIEGKIIEKNERGIVIIDLRDKKRKLIPNNYLPNIKEPLSANTLNNLAGEESQKPLKLTPYSSQENTIIYLKNGGSIEGKIIEKTKKGILLSVLNGKGSIFISNNDIQKLKEEKNAKDDNVSISNSQPKAKADVLQKSLVEAIYLKDVEKIKILIEQGADVNGNNPNKAAGGTLLHFVSYGELEIMRCLIEKGANVNARDNVGLTPLHIVVVGGDKSLEKVKYLLNKGAFVDAKDNYGGTPLYTAIGWACSTTISFRVKPGEYTGHLGLVDYLVKQGAQINARAEDGLTPLGLARKYGLKKIEKYLISKGATE